MAFTATVTCASPTGTVAFTDGGATIAGCGAVALVAGKAADLIGIRLDRLEYAGAWLDPLPATLLCAPVNVELSVINGRAVVEGGQVAGLDVPPLLKRHRRISQEMIARASARA